MPPLDRRTFLRTATAATAAGVIAPATTSEALAQVLPGETRRRTRRSYRRRAADCYRVRVDAARAARRGNLPVLVPTANGEEAEFADRRWSYAKGLPHDASGLVVPSAYDALLAAVASGRPEDFARIPLGGTRRLTSPQAGLAFDLEGPDAFGVAVRPAPRADSAELAAEAAELYWLALARDVPFADWPSDPLVAAAAADLSALSDYRGPRSGDGRVTPATVFRGNARGDLVGPFVSQLLWLPVPMGSLTIDQRQRTLLPGTDFLTAWDAWLAVQSGAEPTATVDDPTPRWIRSLRDLAAYVHADALYQAYLNACLILLRLGAPLAAGLPPARSPNQAGFVEWGGPHVLGLLAEVSTRALKCVWAQKWLVHRRCRPEEFGGRLHARLAAGAAYDVHPELLASDALERTAARFGGWLLPQAFPEGSPTHPSYGAGHATVAGACATVLKAFFDPSWVLPDPVVASADGLALLPWTGPELTVGDEVDKLAANIAIARDAAGVHWRTDYAESHLLGEAVALAILRQQKACHNEPFTMTVRRFDGSVVTI